MRPFVLPLAIFLLACDKPGDASPADTPDPKAAASEKSKPADAPPDPPAALAKPPIAEGATAEVGKAAPAFTLADLEGKPDLRYLEVGVYEGRSLLWMADHVLTDPSTEMVAVDIFAGDYEATFDHNIAASDATDRITKHKGPSADVLRDASLGMFDIIYIDGSHTADDVLADAVLAWRLLSPGGLLIFDDYGWTGRRGTPLPRELLPRMAVDLFLAAYRYEVEAVDVGYQVVVRRVQNPCRPKDYCTPLGAYKYYWREYELRRGDETAVELSDAERGLIEAIAQSRPLGGFEYRIPPNIRASAEYQALTERLELSL